MAQRPHKGVFLCKGKRIHVVYGDQTLHFDFEDFEKFTFMIDDAYHRVKGELGKETDFDLDADAISLDDIFYNLDEIEDLNEIDCDDDEDCC